MKIILRRLTLTNFKGIRYLDIQYDKETSIYGRNASGKTTVFDAFLWTLINKDSTDRTKFGIKTVDKKGEPYDRLSHEVTVVLDIDGEEITLNKVYKEKWVKPTGSKEEKFSGHDNKYFWNGVPMAEKDYNAKIATYINEAQFKMLTNLAYFNTVLKWEDRRAALMQLAGNISDIDVANDLNAKEPGRFNHLIKALTSKKTVVEYRREIVSRKNKIKEEAEQLPARIDEARRNLPVELDYTGIQQQIDALTEEAHEVDQLLNSKSATAKKHEEYITELIKEKGDLDRKLIQLRQSISDNVKDAKQSRTDTIIRMRREISAMENDKAQLLTEYGAANRKVELLVEEKNSLVSDKERTGKQWDAITAETFSFDSSSCTCPTCKQILPNVDVAAKENELRANFNTDKAVRLQRVTDTGKRLAAEINEKDEQIKVAKANLGNIKSSGESKAAEITSKKQSLATLEQEDVRLSSDESRNVDEAIANNSEILSINDKITHIQQQINSPSPVQNNSDLLDRKKNITAQINSLNQQLGTAGQRERSMERIAELENKHSESAQAIADIEKCEFDILDFDKAKMDLVEASINGKFRLVKFRLFERLVNQEEKPTCVTLIDGVPYTDANTASKINASLDIISVFSDHYGIQAPVFIDNRESVTRIIPTGLQIINLIVSEPDEQLRIVTNNELELVA